MSYNKSLSEFSPMQTVKKVTDQTHLVVLLITCFVLPLLEKMAAV